MGFWHAVVKSQFKFLNQVQDYLSFASARLFEWCDLGLLQPCEWCELGQPPPWWHFFFVCLKAESVMAVFHGDGRSIRRQRGKIILIRHFLDAWQGWTCFRCAWEISRFLLLGGGSCSWGRTGRIANIWLVYSMLKWMLDFRPSCGKFWFISDHWEMSENPPRFPLLAWKPPSQTQLPSPSHLPILLFSSSTTPFSLKPSTATRTACYIYLYDFI